MPELVLISRHVTDYRKTGLCSETEWPKNEITAKGSRICKTLDIKGVVNNKNRCDVLK